MKILSKRHLSADNEIYTFDSHPDFYNQETAEIDNYMGFHDQKLYEQTDNHQNNRLNNRVEPEDYFDNMKEKNTPWIILPN